MPARARERLRRGERSLERWREAVRAALGAAARADVGRTHGGGDRRRLVADRRRAGVMFEPQTECWVCGGRESVPVPRVPVRLSRVRRARIPSSTDYTRRHVWLGALRRTAASASPRRCRRSPRFFDRMYDQRWSDGVGRARVRGPLQGLRSSARSSGTLESPHAFRRPRRLLDVGAHAGRFMCARAARGLGRSKGIELNPTTAACAARRPGAIRAPGERAHARRPRDAVYTP